MIGMACLCVFITDLIALAPPWLTGEAVGILEDFLGANAGYYSDKTQVLNDIFWLAALLICAGTGLALFRYLWRRLAFDASRYVEFDLREELLEYLIKLSPKFFDNAKVGDLISRASYDIEMIRLFLSIGLVIVVDVATIELVTIPILLMLNAKLTLYMIIPLPILGVIATKLIRHLSKTSRAVQDHNAFLSAQVQEMYSGANVIKAFNREETSHDRFEKDSEENVAVNIRFARARGFLIGLVMSAAVLVQLIFLYFGGIELINGGLTLADFVKFNFYLVWVVMPMAYLGWGINLYHRGVASMERLREILDVEQEIYDEDMVDPTITEIKGDIEFRDLSFGFDEGSDVLHDLNLKIEAGSTVAIVGRTGSGKSTLVHLLPRLYNPPKGTVFIDGHDIYEIPLEVLRGHIGFVTQEPLLFSETIAENIAFGAPGLSQDKIRESAKLAEVHDEIEDFRKKYDTLLGERGVNISGGQKQRTTVARALAVDPSILVLDDALASIDTDTEEKILSRLKTVRKNSTCLIISHRVSTVKDADKIVVLEDGRITEVGTHEDLLEKRGYYYELNRRQQLLDELEKS